MEDLGYRHSYLTLNLVFLILELGGPANPALGRDRGRQNSYPSMVQDRHPIRTGQAGGVSRK